MKAVIKSTEVLTEIKQMLRLTNSDNDVWINSLIETRARDLSTNETLIIKNCTVKVQNNKFYLPKDCKQLLALRGKNSCINGVFIDVPFFNNCGCNTQLFNSLIPVVSVNGRWANFINTVPDGDEMEIAYNAVNIDADGDVVINEEMYSALANWAAYKFALSYVENYTPEQRNQWKMDASLQGNRVRGLAARRKFEQDKLQIRNAMLTVVQQGLGGLGGTYSFWYNSQYGNINI